jgi:hypothetical protein
MLNHSQLKIRNQSALIAGQAEGGDIFAMGDTNYSLVIPFRAISSIYSASRHGNVVFAPV